MHTEAYPWIKFREPHSKVFEGYYNKILQKIFKIAPPIVAKVTNIRGKINGIETNKDLRGNFFTVKGEECDYEKTNGVESDASTDKLLPEEVADKISNDKNLVNEINFCLNKHFENYDKLPETCINQECKEALIEKIKKNSKKINVSRYETSLSKTINYKIKFEDDCRSNVKYFYPPRFLIVEDNAFGRINLIDILKKQKLDYLIDIAAYGWESIQKFKFFLNKGYIYDIIFMDINLLDMLGSEAAKIMREYERTYTSHHTNIVAVSVEGKKNIMSDTTFDSYCNFFIYLF
jgi:CheY-like chemotaxis protein